jgi:hypothetical protein
MYKEFELDIGDFVRVGEKKGIIINADGEKALVKMEINDNGILKIVEQWYTNEAVEKIEKVKEKEKTIIIKEKKNNVEFGVPSEQINKKKNVKSKKGRKEI